MRFQDAIVYVTSKGFDLEWILSITLMQFKSLLRSCRTIEVEGRISEILDTRIATNGNKKEANDYLRALRGDLDEKVKDSSTELFQRLKQQ